MLRATLFSPSWWISMFCSTLITMCFIVLLKKVGNKVPLVGTITNEV